MTSPAPPSDVQGSITDIVPSLEGSRVQQLHLGGNRITGNVGAQGAGNLCQLVRTSVYVLDLHQNRLNGSLPPCLFNNGALWAPPPPPPQPHPDISLRRYVTCTSCWLRQQTLPVSHHGKPDVTSVTRMNGILSVH